MGIPAVPRRIFARALGPAAALLGRLRYAQKFALVGLILLVPLGSVAGAYIDLQRDQVAFSSKERTGVVLMAPLIDLAAGLVEGRGEAAAGGRATADLSSAVRHIDTLDDRVGQELGTRAAWQKVRGSVLAADRIGPGPADQRRTAFTTAIDSVLTLIVQIGDASNLTLDPDIDSYYLMDTLQFRLPTLLDVAGRSADTAAAQTARLGSDAAMGLGLNHGVITDLRNSLARASNAVTNHTADTRVGAAARDWFSRLDHATRALDRALAQATKSGVLTGVAAPAVAVQQEARAVAQWAAATLDTLLRARISGFTNRAWRVGLGSSAAALLALYLFTGFYLSVTRPIRRIVSALSNVADGDLSTRVPVDTRDEMGFVSVALNDTIARTEMATRRLATRATHDSLTGLPNRSHLLSRLAEALDHRADTGATMCVIFVDLDRFKIINDSLGHQAGDQVLCEIASRMSIVKGGRDIVARLAGDEFVMMCEDLTSVDAAVRLAERIVEAVSEPVLIRLQAASREVSVCASVGIAVAGGPGRFEPEDLLRDADVAMYHAKQRGRGRVEVFDDTLRIAVQSRMDRLQDLRRGIGAGEIQVYYQPIVTAATGRLVGFEALARWHHPTQGVLGALDFIDVAEESGLILQLGTSVLRQACRQAAEWRAHRPDCADLKITVNVSATQFADATFVDTVAQILTQTGLHPDALWLEITETCLMADAAASRLTLDRVRALGVHLAVDDFGTGYSSMAYLRRFPVETLKIDRSFVQGVGGDPDDDAIIATIVALARTLNMTIVAEGVETPAQLDRLVALECDMVQGYLFDRPSPADRAWFGNSSPMIGVGAAPLGLEFFVP